ncbi:MAG: hypothetical protein FWC16_12025 [Defluviitaleaceae bacterium]|nr:hypothetical protein [Defluviitaleaceae bacterium]MCL2275646.1 hypothetical protein [Defluviitaleaceae bacterium]
MTAMEKWNRIVDLYSKNFNAMENTIEGIWENIFADYFGFLRLENEIERQRKIPIGTTQRPTADIVIKNGCTDLYIVELKRHSLSFSTEMESQLLSYLKLLRIKVGILICDKIYLYAYDNTKTDKEQVKISIAFEKDNPDGVKFIELFNKLNYSEPNVQAFILQRIAAIKNIELIKDEITPSLIEALLRKYFTDKYDDFAFEQAIGGIHISVSQQIKTLTTEPDTIHAEKINRISKSKAKEICMANGIPVSENLNYANRAEGRDFYAIDPQIERLKQKWWMLLIDPFERNLHVFEIPPNALATDKIKHREKGVNTFLLRFKVGDNSFEDTLSNIRFIPWLVKIIQF